MSDRNRAFDHAMEDGFRRYCAIAPEVATFAGIHEHDGRLPRADREGLEQRLAELGRWADGMAAAKDGVTPDRAYDADLLRRIHALHRFEHDELRPWESNPDALGDYGNLFFLASFGEYPSPEARIEAMAGRLEAIPGNLIATRARVTRPEPRWARIAAEVAESFPELTKGLAEDARATAGGALSKRVDAAAAAAAAAALEHAGWCRARADGPERWPIGRERFSKLLQLKGIRESIDELEELGESRMRELLAERDELAEKVAPGRGVPGALEVLKADHPRSFGEALAVVRDLVAKSRAKVVADGIAEIGFEETIEVIETPPFMRPLTPFAAIFPALRASRIQRGLYVVTPPSGDAGLEEVHYADLRNVVCHEGYPGHHLQLACANKLCRVVRSVDLGGFPSYAGTTFAIDLVEGWAHYCEQLMKEHGFHDGPADRFQLVNDALWRAVRVVLDVRLHTGRIDAAGAVDMLVSRTGMSREGATGEVNRYTMTPTYQLSYMLGKHLLLKLRAEFHAAGKSEAEFHRFVLSCGSVPVGDLWTLRDLGGVLG